MAQEYKIINENINESGGITDSEISYVSTTASTVTFAGLNANSITGTTVHGSFYGSFYGNADNLTNIYNITGVTYNLGVLTLLNGNNGLSVSGISKIDNVINVGKSGDVNFTSIRDAVNSITDSSTVNPYAVLVGPGMYVEGPITMKTGVFVVGDSLGSVLVVPTGSTDTIFIGADGASINNLILTSASSGLAVYHKGSGGTGFLIKDCNFNGNQRNVHCYGETSTSIVYIDRCSFTGNNTRGIIVDNLTGTTSQVVLTNSTYKDIIPPVTTEFIVVSGSNTTFTMTNTTLRSSGGTCVTVYDGGDFRAVGSTIRGFDTAITTLNIGNSPNLILDGISIGECTNDLLINHTGTTGYFNGVAEYSKITITEVAPFYVYGSDPHIITVGVKGEDFTSIVDAVDSIVDASITNRYVVKIGPGQYYENLIDLSTKEYISIVGTAIQATEINPISNSQHIIKLGPNCEVSFLTLRGAGSGYAALFSDDSGDFSQAHKVSIYDCDIGILTESSTQDTIFYGEYIDINGEYSYGLKVIANNGFMSKVNIENYYNFPTGTGTTISNYVSGTGSTLSVYVADNISNGSTGSTAFYLQDGASLTADGVNNEGWGYGLRVLNVGLPSTFNISSTAFRDSLSYDFSVEHAGTVGTLEGLASHTKINNNSSNITWSFLDLDDGEFEITKQLSVTFDDGTHTDLSTLLFEGGTMGVLDGGVITNVSGLTINVSEGFGYLEKFPDVSIIKRIDWVSTNLVLPSGSTNYIYFNENGTLSNSGSIPNSVYNIILGKVVTDSSIKFIESTPLSSNHTSNRYAELFRDGVGSLYSNGSIVTENITPLHLDVSAGEYFYSTNKFTPSGGNNITFVQYYRSGISDWATTATTVVNNTQYDNNGTLTGLTAGYYTKHTLYLVGDGVNEKYFLVIGQNQYSTLVSAEDALLPTPPTYFSDSVVQVANIYVQQGFSGITEIEDIRPVIGFKAGGVNASSVHGNLLGLSADDHTQYLLVDGGRSMSGNLDLGANNIINTGTINGVTIETHASRHQHGGSDEVGTSTPAPNAIPKADVNGKLNTWVDDYYVTGGTYSNGTLTLNRQNGTVVINGFSTGTTSIDTYVTGFTYSNNNFTISQNGGQQPLSVYVNNMTGLTVNGTLSATTLQVTNIKIDGPTVAGYVLTADANGNGTWQVTSATGTTSGGGSSRITGSTTTTNATPTIVDTIDTIPNNNTSLIDVYVKAYQSGGTNWGIWKRTLAVTKVSNTVTVQQVNADVDKQSSGLKSYSLSFTVNSGNIDIYVTGIAATTISWNSAYEIIV